MRAESSYFILDFNICNKVSINLVSCLVKWIFILPNLLRTPRAGLRAGFTQIAGRGYEIPARMQLWADHFTRNSARLKDKDISYLSFLLTWPYQIELVSLILIKIVGMFGVVEKGVLDASISIVRGNHLSSN